MRHYWDTIMSSNLKMIFCYGKSHAVTKEGDLPRNV